MAIISATFRLKDEASPALAKIAAEAQLVDDRLARISNRVKHTERDTGNSSRNMERDFRTHYGKVSDTLERVDKQLGKITNGGRGRRIGLRADTRKAENDLGRLRDRIRSLTWWTDRGSKGLKSMSNWGQKAGVNIGPFSLRLKSLLPVFVFLGGPIMATISAGLTGITTALTALVAGGIAAVSMFGALAFGIGALAIPIAMAVKGFMKKNDALKQATARLDKARAGTKAYKNALRDVANAQSHFNKNEREMQGNLILLRGTWHRLVTDGKSGGAAIDIINSSLRIANQLLPSVVRQMDRFSRVGQGLFRSAEKNQPAFTNELNKTMKPWPHMFQQEGQAGGHFMMGMLRVLQAANPLAERISTSILRTSINFDRWTSKPQNMARMTKFFNRMGDVLMGGHGHKGLSDLLFDIAKAFVQISNHNVGNTGTLIDQLDKFVRGSVPFLDKMTDDFQKMWPAVDHVLGAIGKSLLFSGKIGTTTISFIDKLLTLADKHRSMRLVADAMTAIYGISLVPGGKGALKGGAKGLGGLLGGLLTRKGAVAAAEGGAGKLAKRATGIANLIAPDVHVTNTMLDPVPVWVVNQGGLGGPGEPPGEGPGGRGRGGRGPGRWGLGGKGVLTAVGGLAAALGLTHLPRLGGGGNSHPHPRHTPHGQPVGIPSPSAAASVGAERGNNIRNYPGWILRHLAQAQPNNLTATQALAHHNGAGRMANKWEAMLALGPLALLALPEEAAVGGLGALGRFAIPKLAGAGAGALGFGAAAAPAMAHGNSPDKMAGQHRRAAQGVLNVTRSVISTMSSIVNVGTRQVGNFFTSLMGRVGATISAIASGVSSALSSASQAAANGGGGAAPGTGGVMPNLGAGPGFGLPAGGGAVPKGVSPAFGSIIPLAKQAGLSISSTTGGKHANGSLHYSGRAIDFAVPGLQVPDSRKQAFYNSMVPFAQSGALAELIYNHDAWFGGKHVKYDKNDHLNHVHVGVSAQSGGPSQADKTRAKGSGRGALHVSFKGAEFHIHNGDDYDTVARKLAEGLKRELAGMTGADTSEMIGA